MTMDLMGLQFKKFDEIKDFENKLSIFLRSLEVELLTWRDYVERDDKRFIPNPIKGIACLDGDQIIGISYFGHKNRSFIEKIFWLLFSKRETVTGAVVKKEYQGRGINTHARKLKKNI